MDAKTCNKHDRDGVRCGKPGVYYNVGDGCVSYYCREHGERIRERFINGDGWTFPSLIGER